MMGSGTARPAVAPHPFGHMVRHHLEVLWFAWQQRAGLAGAPRLADEAAFLPAALSLQETPLHPAPRRFAFAIMALFSLALLWAVVGRVDVVAVAHGRIVVSERTKIVQPLERSVVKAILVQDGDHVVAGQPLVELDPTAALADRTAAQEQVRSSVTELLRVRTLARLLRDAYPERQSPAGAPGLPVPAPAAQGGALDDTQLQAEWRDIRARMARLASEVDRRQSEIATARAVVDKLEATVPLALGRERDYKRLVELGYVSGHATQDRTRERLELERDLATQHARLAETQAAMQESESARAAYLAEVARNLSERETQGQLKAQLATQEQSKANRREKLTTLAAPVAGVVQQRAIHSVGGVVTEAQALLVIVPDGAGYSAEVTLDNKDVGYVNAGQGAEIKLETFPFTRYGTVPATVQRVTSDAVTDDKRGAVFPATLALNTSHIDVDGKMIRLAPGMNVTAEIKTGQRRVIEYLLSPIQRAGMESLRER